MCAHFILLNTGPWLRREWKSKTYCWGHQNSGDRAPEVWCPSKLTNRFSVLISRMGFRNMNFSCLSSVFMCFTQNLVILEHCQHKMSMHWSENPLKKGGGTRVLVPGHLKSGVLSSWATVFYFNLKTGHQKYEFLLFSKCLYVFHTKPGYIRTLPAWNEHALVRKHSK